MLDGPIPASLLQVAFTCNACQHRSTKAINPSAYKTGTVFVQCEGCFVHHKLIDNLKLFHDMSGPIYGAAAARTPAAPAVELDGFRSGGFDLFRAGDIDAL